MSIGVIGGLGPMATAVFMKRVINMTDAAIDQEHPDMIIYSAPRIPDRTAYILGKSTDSPLPHLLELAHKLEDQGSKVIAVPCITACYFNADIKNEINVPVIHGVNGTADYLARNGIKKVGILATEGSVKSEVIQNVLEKRGIEAIRPDAKTQELVTTLIFEQVKKGLPADISMLQEARDRMVAMGAEVCLLGCTELSVIREDCTNIGTGFFDILDMLAAQSVQLSGHKVRDKYKYLLE